MYRSMRSQQYVPFFRERDGCRIMVPSGLSAFRDAPLRWAEEVNALEIGMFSEDGSFVRDPSQTIAERRRVASSSPFVMADLERRKLYVRSLDERLAYLSLKELPADLPDAAYIAGIMTARLFLASLAFGDDMEKALRDVASFRELRDPRDGQNFANGVGPLRPVLRHTKLYLVAELLALGNTKAREEEARPRVVSDPGI